MFTNQITGYIHEVYGVTTCTHNTGKNNYYTIQEIKKCSTSCMEANVTLYIYACSYEDALTKVSNMQCAFNSTIEEAGSAGVGAMGKDDVFYYIVITPIIIDIIYLNLEFTEK